MNTGAIQRSSGTDKVSAPHLPTPVLTKHSQGPTNLRAGGE